MDAGRKIWIASGVIERGALRIEECRRAEELPGSGRGRAHCLESLTNFIAAERACAFGLDFPFGLPRVLVKEESWEDFVLAFPSRYSSPAEFREACRLAAGGAELRRVTDLEARTPFSVYNLRLYRQTYFGIRDLLYPLVRDQLACVLPIQRPFLDRPWIFEICPASLLKREKLYLPYKGGTQEHRRARARILNGIESSGHLSVRTSKLRTAVMDDHHGDALDSVTAAFATFQALSKPAGLAAPGNGAYALEGYVYV